MIRSLAVAVLLFAPSARAAQTLSFDAALGELRQNVLATRAGQIAARSDTLAQRIESLARESDRRAWDVSRLRDRLRDIRWRARNSRHPGRPGQDPFLRSDIDRLTWDLRDLNRGEDEAVREAARILSAAQKDPALVGPAQNLRSRADRLQTESSWLDSDARMSSWDIRDAGFNMEAFEIERNGSDAARSGRQLDSLASQILDKVR